MNLRVEEELIKIDGEKRQKRLAFTPVPPRPPQFAKLKEPSDDTKDIKPAFFAKNTGCDREIKKQPPQLNSRATVQKDPIYQTMKYVRGFSKVFEPEQPEPDQTMIPEPRKKKKRGLDKFLVKGQQNRPAPPQYKKKPSKQADDDLLVVLD